MLTKRKKRCEWDGLVMVKKFRFETFDGCKSDELEEIQMKNGERLVHEIFVREEM